MKHILLLLLCFAAGKSFAQKPPPSRNTGGGSTTLVGPSLTSPSNFEDIPVYRLQVQFVTADVTDAGTDDNVFLTMNSTMTPYYLNLSGDDRERKSDEKYDLVTNEIQFLRDIKDITITKSGTDGWGVKSFTLIVNGFVVFQKDYSSPQWIDGDDQRSPILTFSSNALRSAGLWNSNNGRTQIFMPPRSYTKLDIKNIVESFIGGKNIPQRSRTFWGDYDGYNTRFGDDVEVKFRNNQTVSVDLDLELRDDAPYPDTEIDDDFDIVVSCSSGKPTVTIQNYSTEHTGDGVSHPNPGSLSPIGKYLSRSFTLPNCSPHFDAGGNLIYW